MVAGGNRRDQRNQGQIDRVVPRRNDADHAYRPVLHLGARRPENPSGHAMPVLGNLFKKTGRSDTKAELLIFVTPRILSESLR